MQKKLLSLFLLASLILSTACGAEKTPDNETTAPSDTTASAETSDNTPKLGVTKEDNGGREFNILIPTHAKYEYDVEQTGDIVDDAVYSRNMNVSDLLGIKFNFTVQDGHWDQRSAFVNTISNDVLSGDGQFDLISGLLVAVAPSTQEGYYIEGGNLEHCDFSKPWWVQGMYDNFSIGGKLYEFIGDSSLTLYKDLSVVYFNKRIFDDYSLEDPYAIVRSGDWTLDKFIELGTATGSDVNGDGVWDIKTDQFGTDCERIVLGKMEVAIGADPFERNGDEITIAPGLSERFVTAYEKLYNFVFNNDNVYSMNTHDDGTYLSAVYFGEGRVGMSVNFLKNTELIRDMKDDFGIVPMPKFDKDQESYRCSLGTSISVMLVPQTTKDAALTSKVMEALCYYSYKDVTPKYYEVALKEKYSRDEDIKEMLTIIRDSATMSFAMFNAQLIGDPLPSMTFTTGGNYTAPGELASNYEKNLSTVESNLEKVLESYSALD